MIFNVSFDSSETRFQLWETLSSVAKKNHIELEESSEGDSLYFTHSKVESKALTVISLNPEMNDCDFKLAEISHTTLELVLRWHEDRKSLESIRIHRHTLGNLIVILLSKIMKYENKFSKEEKENLDKLHLRFSDLYTIFESINPKRFKRDTLL